MARKLLVSSRKAIKPAGKTAQHYVQRTERDSQSSSSSSSGESDRSSVSDSSEGEEEEEVEKTSEAVETTQPAPEEEEREVREEKEQANSSANGPVDEKDEASEEKPAEALVQELHPEEDEEDNKPIFLALSSSLLEDDDDDMEMKDLEEREKVKEEEQPADERQKLGALETVAVTPAEVRSTEYKLSEPMKNKLLRLAVKREDTNRESKSSSGRRDAGRMEMDKETSLQRERKSEVAPIAAPERTKREEREKKDREKPGSALSPKEREFARELTSSLEALSRQTRGKKVEHEDNRKASAPVKALPHSVDVENGKKRERTKETKVERKDSSDMAASQERRRRSSYADEKVKAGDKDSRSSGRRGSREDFGRREREEEKEQKLPRSVSSAKREKDGERPARSSSFSRDEKSASRASKPQRKGSTTTSNDEERGRERVRDRMTERAKESDRSEKKRRESTASSRSSAAPAAPAKDLDKVNIRVKSVDASADRRKRKNEDTAAVGQVESKRSKPATERSLRELKEAAERLKADAISLKHEADKRREDKAKRALLYLQAGLKFVEHAVELGNCSTAYKSAGDSLKAKNMISTALGTFSTTADLFNFCAHQFLEVQDKTKAAISYKCSAVLYMRYFQLQRSKLHHILVELRTEQGSMRLKSLSQTSKSPNNPTPDAASPPPSLSVSASPIGSFVSSPQTAGNQPGGSGGGTGVDGIDHRAGELQSYFFKEMEILFKSFDSWQRSQRYDPTAMKEVTEFTLLEPTDLVQAVRNCLDLNS